MQPAESLEDARVAAVILAAGGSSRLGRPKQLVRLPNSPTETLIERAARFASESGADPVIVVLGAHRVEIIESTDLARYLIVENEEWPSGMASSIRAGLSAAIKQRKQSSGVLLMTCDQPALSASHLSSLLAAHASEPRRVTASRFAGTLGTPAVVPRSMFPALLQLSGDQGASAIFRQPQYPVQPVDFPAGEWDIDTPADLQRGL